LSLSSLAPHSCSRFRFFNLQHFFDALPCLALFLLWGLSAASAASVTAATASSTDAIDPEGLVSDRPNAASSEAVTSLDSVTTAQFQAVGQEGTDAAELFRRKLRWKRRLRPSFPREKRVRSVVSVQTTSPTPSFDSVLARAASLTSPHVLLLGLAGTTNGARTVPRPVDVAISVGDGVSIGVGVSHGVARRSMHVSPIRRPIRLSFAHIGNSAAHDNTRSIGSLAHG
jgi:hypothetical protein